MQLEVILQRFFNALIGGDRQSTRAIIDELLDADCPADGILHRLFWPTLEYIQKLHRHDQMSDAAHHFATRLLRSWVDQMQLRLEQKPRRDRSTLVVCGPEESEEIGGQIVADALEADGCDVYFIGGGVANDEIVQQLAEIRADVLVVFGVVPSTVPFTRVLIDRLRDIGACPDLQVVVGGGVVYRAEGLAEEIGADLWAKSPEEIVKVIADHPDRRMTPNQRTVGRKHRSKRNVAAA